jgi:multiple sugar transport system ATP-binding protein
VASVRLDQVVKVYGNGQLAVERADLDVRDGELLVVVGPSGCGKSTVLRLIAGLESATSGSIWIGDRLVDSIPPGDRDVAMVFQNYALYPHMTVGDNLGFGLRLRGVPAAERERQVRDAAERLGLRAVLHRRPRELSGGQRQRVALGRALVRAPQVFLFDEPLSNLDARLRVQTRAEINQLHRQLGATMIYVTHDQVEAMTLGERIAVMHEGRIEQIDTPMALYDAPINRRVAGFLGSPAMNFLEGEIVHSEGCRFRAADGLAAIPLPLDRCGPLTPSETRRVVLGVRPEDVRLEDSASRQAVGGMIQAEVELCEPLGNEVLLHTTIGTQELTLRLPPSCRRAPGDRVTITFDTDKLHFFDPVTGQRLRPPSPH